MGWIKHTFSIRRSQHQSFLFGSFARDKLHNAVYKSFYQPFQNFTIVHTYIHTYVCVYIGLWRQSKALTMYQTNIQNSLGLVHTILGFPYKLKHSFIGIGQTMQTVQMTLNCTKRHRKFSFIANFQDSPLCRHSVIYTDFML